MHTKLCCLGMPALSCVTAMACLVILEFYGLKMRHCKMAIVKKPHMNFGIVENFLNDWLLHIFPKLQEAHKEVILTLRQRNIYKKLRILSAYLFNSSAPLPKAALHSVSFSSHCKQPLFHSFIWSTACPP